MEKINKIFPLCSNYKQSDIHARSSWFFFATIICVAPSIAVYHKYVISLLRDFSMIIHPLVSKLRVTFVELQRSTWASILSRALCCKASWAIWRLVGPTRLLEKGCLVCKHSKEVRMHRTIYLRLGRYLKCVPCNHMWQFPVIKMVFSVLTLWSYTMLYILNIDIFWVSRVVIVL